MKVARWSASKPTSTRCRLSSVRENRTADTTSTIDSAICPTIIVLPRAQDEVVWELAFDTAQDVSDFQARLTLSDGVTLEAEGKRLFLAGSGTPPDFMLETGRKFLSAPQ